MGFREDSVNALRRTILPQLHYVVHGTFEGYAVSHTTEDEYVGTVHCTEDEIEAMLSEIDFSRNPIASLKVRFDGNTSEGSWVWRDHPFADDQLHVVLHADEDRDDRVDVYAHWERSWIRHPYAHYVARGYDADRGVELTRRLLEQWDGHSLSGGRSLAVERDSMFVRWVSEHLSLSIRHATEMTLAIRNRLPLVDGEPSFTRDTSGERDAVSPHITDDI